METTLTARIEESIFALPISEQRRLIARVSKVLRQRVSSEMDAKLSEMASDPDIRREITEIEREFGSTEMDGLD